MVKARAGQGVGAWSRQGRGRGWEKGQGKVRAGGGSRVKAKSLYPLKNPPRNPKYRGGCRGGAPGWQGQRHRDVCMIASAASTPLHECFGSGACYESSAGQECTASPIVISTHTKFAFI